MTIRARTRPTPGPQTDLRKLGVSQYPHKAFKTFWAFANPERKLEACAALLGALKAHQKKLPRWELWKRFKRRMENPDEAMFRLALWKCSRSSTCEEFWEPVRGWVYRITVKGDNALERYYGNPPPDSRGSS